MSRLGYIHRRLWQRQGSYRVSFVFGPALLSGALLGSAAWAVAELLLPPGPPPPIPWAAVEHPVAAPVDGSGLVASPAHPIPPQSGAHGLSGYVPGWVGSVHPIELSPTLDVNVKPDAIPKGVLPVGTVDMTDVLGSGPPMPRFVLVGTGYLVAKSAGTYLATIRFERPAAATASCLTRLSLGPHRLVSNVTVDLAEETDRIFSAPKLALEPGLYPFAWAFGCWNAAGMVRPGSLTVLLARPGEQNPRPIDADDVVRTNRSR